MLASRGETRVTWEDANGNRWLVVRLKPVVIDGTRQGAESRSRGSAALGADCFPAPSGRCRAVRGVLEAGVSSAGDSLEFDDDLEIAEPRNRRRQRRVEALRVRPRIRVEGTVDPERDRGRLVRVAMDDGGSLHLTPREVGSPRIGRRPDAPYSCFTSTFDRRCGSYFDRLSAGSSFTDAGTKPRSWNQCEVWVVSTKTRRRPWSRHCFSTYWSS